MHLLAVDDEPAILELIELLVQFSGKHTITTAPCVVDALDILAQPDAPRIDCFLIDIQMPGTDGIELCKILRDRPDHHHTPILMLTAMSDKAYVDRAFAAGASDYITKPFEVEDLSGRLKLIEDLVANRDTMHGADAGTEADNEDPDARHPLHEPFHIREVDGVIDHMALENYVAVMSRRKLFGSSVFGVTLRDIETLHARASRFEYECLITDVAEAIAICLDDHQFLLTYAGNGTFLCVVEDGYQPKPEAITDRVNLTLHRMGLYFNDGSEIDAAVSVGEVIRLVWKNGNNAKDALAAAHESAEKESRRHATRLEDFWHPRATA